MNLLQVLLLTSEFIIPLVSGIQQRVIEGWDDVDNRYPYVVSLESEEPMRLNYEIYRYCTGSLITHQWVLTAAHCITPFKDEPTVVRYGDMTIHRNATKSISRVLKSIPHPNSLLLTEPLLYKNDIGLMLVENIPMTSLGRLSSADFKSLIGLPVTIAGYGVMKAEESPTSMEKRGRKPLQLGEGVIADARQVLNVVTKCNNTRQQANPGDSGGPLFVDDRIVGVLTGGSTFTKRKRLTAPVEYFTPVSPYLDWIKTTIRKLK